MKSLYNTGLQSSSGSPDLSISSVPDTESSDNVEKSEDNVDSLRARLGIQLKSLDQLKPPEGVATGLDILDDFLLWGGIPKGELSLFLGKAGSGATSLWLQSVRRLHTEDKWAAWINSDWKLMPAALIARQINLNRLLVVNKPQDSNLLYWTLQELIASSLFEVIGCHLPESLFKNHQLQKLRHLARKHNVAIVLVSHAKGWKLNPIFSLVIECAHDFFTVRRASHRPTPFVMSASQVMTKLHREEVLQTDSFSLKMRHSQVS